MNASRKIDKKLWFWVHIGGVAFLALCYALHQKGLHPLDGGAVVLALLLAFSSRDHVLRWFVLAIIGYICLRWGTV